MAQDHPGVFGGVDTHKHTHVAAAIDGAGRLLGTAAFDAAAAGYTALPGMAPRPRQRRARRR